jgi:hypothetical protein
MAAALLALSPVTIHNPPPESAQKGGRVELDQSGFTSKRNKKSEYCEYDNHPFFEEECECPKRKSSPCVTPEVDKEHDCHWREHQALEECIARPHNVSWW